MNKISKKIVALVTMAAFVLTLVPMAAFAAGENTDPSASDFTLDVSAAGQIKVTLDLNQTGGSSDATEFTDTLVKVVVDGLPDTATVQGSGSVMTTASQENVDTLANEGVKPAADTTFTFDKVSTGTHNVSVYVKKDASSEFVQIKLDGQPEAAPAPAQVVNNADAEQSSFSVVKNDVAQSEATASVGDGLTAQFSILDGYQVPVSDTNRGLDNVKIWAVREGQTQPTTALTVTGVNGVNVTDNGNDGLYEVTNKVVDANKVKVSFKNSGTYTLYAGVLTGTDVKDAVVLGGGTKITVDAQSVEVASVAVDLGSDFNKATDNKANENAIKDGDTLKLTAKDSLLLNGIDPAKLTVTATQANGNPAGNVNYTLRSSSSNLVLKKTDVTTDAYGKFDIDFTIAKADTYRIYVDGADVSFVIEINAENSAINGITTTASNAQTMLAGTDKNFKDNVTAGNYLLDEAVQFEITDKSGNVVKNNALTGEPAATAGGDHDSYLTVTAPEDSTLTSDDLVLAWSEAKEAYTLKYTGSYNDAKKDLVPGKYEVKVALKSGETAKASFTLANYGTTKDMTMTMTYGGVEVTDEVVLKDASKADTTNLVAEAKLVDENGIKIKAGDSIQYGFVGQAVNQTATTNAQNDTAVLKAEDESLLGTVVKVIAYNTETGKMITSELTVVDGYNEYSLAFEGDKGPINENNEVTVKVVDKDGNLAKTVNGTLFATVDSQSNEDAKVYVEPKTNITDGKGTLTINSDKETTVKVAVMVKDNTDSDKSGAIYVGSLDYTIGGEDVNADTSVVMTMGSTDYVVNNNIVDGDAAPYVDSNWRTMVPIRALAETFGAEVDYDNDARTVTIVDGDTTIVMTIDSTTYTINGEEQTMDTAAVIGSGDRTYVPVRFVAEALGYTVTPLQDANNLTASVVFQK